MRLDHYTFVFAGLLRTALCLTTSFDPISKPEKGEVVEAGSTYIIEWNPTASYPGPVILTLETGKNTNSLNEVQIITPMVESDVGRYRWSVPEFVPPNERFFIKIGSIDDYAVVNYSPPFKIKGSRDVILSSHTMSGVSSSTALVTTTTSTTATGTSTGSASTSGPASTSTSSGVGSAATRVVPASVAMVGAVAYGVLAL